MPAEPFQVPQLKDQVGWRLLEQDKKDLRILMADRREKSPTKLLRSLIQQEAAIVRRRWVKNLEQRQDEDTTPPA